MKKRINPSSVGSNAKKALQELMFFPSERQDSPVDAIISPAPESTPAKENHAREPRARESRTGEPRIRESISSELYPSETRKPAKSNSILTADLEIKGNISAQGNLEIHGTVYGDVCSTGKLVICGSITGNVEAEELIVTRGTIKAQTITVSQTCTLEEGTHVEGDITCQNISVNAQLKGNLSASQGCSLLSSCVIQGNLTTENFHVQSGAVLNGMVAISASKV